jgi:hypothetical protein
MHLGRDDDCVAQDTKAECILGRRLAAIPAELSSKSAEAKTLSLRSKLFTSLVDSSESSSATYSHVFLSLCLGYYPGI